ncbi:MAG TPA: hypothetical protein VH539_09785, partial [Gemmatimonadaceae bacterium]
MFRRTEVAVLLLLTTRAVVAQTPIEAGKWDGLARLPGQSIMRVTITLDSSAVGWTGMVLVPSARPQPFPMSAVVRNQDSLIVRLPAEAQNAVLRLKISSDGKQMAGIIEAQARGTVSAARAGSPEAAALTESLTRLERSRDAANRLAASVPKAPPPSANPDSARLVTSDIPLFWRTLDRAPADSLAEYLQREYLEKASVGVRDFIQGRIMSAEDLATAVRSNRVKYDSVRAANLDVVRAEPQIRAAFRKLKELYPDAVFPDVYFVIGRFNTGGTASPRGLLIGAEMYRDPAALPGIVAHELIHFQQHYPSQKLLEHAFMEGSADFVGNLIAGRQINNAAHQYGMPH